MLEKSKMGVLGIAVLATVGTSVPAAKETANLGVTAVVADTCILAAGTALSFATVSTDTASNEVTPGLVTVTCTASRPAVTLSLGGGDNLSGTQRRMASVGGDYLPYSVYSDAGHSSAVAVAGAIYSGAITAAPPKAVSVYGQVPAGAYNAGAYSDTLLVTLSY